MSWSVYENCANSKFFLVQIRENTEKNTKKTPYLDTFYTRYIRLIDQLIEHKDSALSISQIPKDSKTCFKY